MGDEGLQVADPTNLSDFTKLMGEVITHAKEIKEAGKTLTEQKKEVDEAKADIAKALETINKERKEASTRTVNVDATKEDTGFGYHVKEIVTKSEFRRKSFNEILLVDTEENNALKSLQARASDVYLVGAILAGEKNVPVSHFDWKSLKIYQDYMKDTEDLRKAMSIGAGEAGNEWIPTGFSADLIEIFHLQLVVARLFPSFTIPQKMTSWTVPGTSSDLQSYRTTAAATDNPTKFRATTRGTRKLIFTPEKLVAATLFDTELEEDSIIQVLPNLKRNIAEAQMRATEDTMINGDTASPGSTIDVIDMHGRTIDAESPSQMWDGLRKFVTDNGSVRQNAAGGATFGGMITVMRNMGKYSITPSKLFWLTGPNGYYDAMISLSQVQTIDLFGPQAIVQKGELARLMGIPIIVSEQERQDLKTTTGISGGGSSTYNDTSIQLVWKGGFSYGIKRKITVESAKIQRTDSVEVWSTMRSDFQANYATSEEIVSEITNVS